MGQIILSVFQKHPGPFFTTCTFAHWGLHLNVQKASLSFHDELASGLVVWPHTGQQLPYSSI